MVGQIVLRCRDILLQMVRSNLRVFANGDSSIFRNIQQAAQTVAGNDAAEMILQCVGLRIRIPIPILIIICSGGDGIPSTYMNPISGDFRVIRYCGVRGGIDSVIHTGAAYADDAAMAFLGSEAGFIFLGSNKIYFPLDIPLAAESAGNVIRRFIIHMGAHIAHQTAATCVGQGLARVLAISRYL